MAEGVWKGPLFAEEGNSETLEETRSAIAIGQTRRTAWLSSLQKQPPNQATETMVAASNLDRTSQDQRRCRPDMGRFVGHSRGPGLKRLLIELHCILSRSLTQRRAAHQSWCWPGVARLRL